MRVIESLRKCAIGFSALVALGSACIANASAIYGTVVGPHITYKNIAEVDSQLTGPPAVASTPAALFGAPILSPPGSDNLSFPNLSFSALAASGSFMFQDGKLTMDIVPTTADVSIHNLNFDEGGAWRVLGVTGKASSEATLLFNDVRITSVNGVALGSPIIVSPSFSESSLTQVGSANIVSSPGDISFTSTGSNAVGTWNIAAFFNLDAALVSAEISGRITGISVALNNQLLAQTQTDESLTLATIDKKHFIITGGTTSGVPEPALAGASILFCIATIARKAGRRQHAN